MLWQCGRYRRKQRYMNKLVNIWTNDSVQPKLLAVDSDHRFVEHNVIRVVIVA